MYEKFMDAAEEIYTDGMFRFEQLCEILLVNSDFSDDLQSEFQEKILDNAQRIFEQEMKK